MSSGQPPSSESQEDGVTQGHNSNTANVAATGGTAVGDEEWRGEGGIRPRKGRRAMRANVKMGMRSSCDRARKW